MVLETRLEGGNKLLHNLQVDLLPVDLLGVLGWKLCALEQFRINTAGHYCGGLGGLGGCS